MVATCFCIGCTAYNLIVDSTVGSHSDFCFVNVDYNKQVAFGAYLTKLIEEFESNKKGKGNNMVKDANMENNNILTQLTAIHNHIIGLRNENIDLRKELKEIKILLSPQLHIEGGSLDDYMTREKQAEIRINFEKWKSNNPSSHSGESLEEVLVVRLDDDTDPTREEVLAEYTIGKVGKNSSFTGEEIITKLFEEGGRGTEVWDDEILGLLHDPSKRPLKPTDVGRVVMITRKGSRLLLERWNEGEDVDGQHVRADGYNWHPTGEYNYTKIGESNLDIQSYYYIS